jgi:3-deoxy-D-manno-octulosonic-acid transferase
MGKRILVSENEKEQIRSLHENQKKEINYFQILENKVNELLISIGSIPVDNLGNIKFDFYPEKISINDIGLWFVEGNELDSSL